MSGEGAVGSAIPDAETLFLPTQERMESIHLAAQQNGWASQKELLRAAARRALSHEKLAAATAWLRLYRWAALLGQTEEEFIPTWLEEVKRAGVGHDAMASRYWAGPLPLSESMSGECQSWVLRHSDFSEEFFSLVSSVDYAPRVLYILSELHQRDAKQFQAYASLAIAVAVVYDLPPPANWPHAQVSAKVMPRKWADPVKVFDWFVRQDRQGKTYHSLQRLRADELKFVVDIAAADTELEWAQEAVALPLDQLEQAYGMVRYQEDRTLMDRAMWPGKDYALSTILTTGGICVDQAYFASHVGKARGVPTLFFSGVGNDGRHAWFGFLDHRQQWQLNAGRFAEQRFVTGFARDPQTWTQISDHDLRLMSERFRSSPAFQLSRVMVEFASDFLNGGDFVSAEKAARKAVNHERRHPRAWDLLIAAETALGREPRKREATLREAMIALVHYPDLEVFYSRRISESLRARGEKSAADHEQRRVAKKYALERDDLSLQQAREALWRAGNTAGSAQLILTYNATVDRLGQGADIAFFDEIVVPFAEYLLQRNQIADARSAVERARRTLRIAPDSQLAQEFAALAAKVEEHR